MRLERSLALTAILAVCVCAQSSRPETSQTSVAGRRANQLTVPAGQATVHGILIDGGCRDRDSMNLGLPPEDLQQAAPAQPAGASQNNPPVAGAVSAKGISVDSTTIDAERAGVMEAHVPGMFERQTDPTCAVTGNTTNFAVLSDNGRLLDLDQGGNTLALIAVQSTSAGRAMLNGQGPGLKPRVTVQGQLRGDRLVAKDVSAGN
jgi:hypothetical protein